jgi:hypothetical protein
MDELERTRISRRGVDLSALADIDPSARTAVLERLGPAHFRSKGFSFMGLSADGLRPRRQAGVAAHGAIC